MMELNVIASDAPETGQYLSERCHDQIFCAMAESIKKTYIIMSSSIGMSSEASVGYALSDITQKNRFKNEGIINSTKKTLSLQFVAREDRRPHYSAFKSAR